MLGRPWTLWIAAVVRCLVRGIDPLIDKTIETSGTRMVLRIDSMKYSTEEIIICAKVNGFSAMTQWEFNLLGLQLNYSTGIQAT